MKGGADGQLPGAIQPGQVFTLEQFERATGYGKAALRTLRRKGLRVVYLSNRGFVRSDDFLTFLDAHGKPNEQN